MKYEQFEILGHKFHWEIQYYDSYPLLKCDSIGYKEPWLLVKKLGIDNEIEKTRPKKNKSYVGNNNHIRFIPTEGMYDYLNKNIHSNTWYLYSINEFHEVITKYISGGKEDKTEETKGMIILQIIDELNSNLTINLISGDEMTCVIKKVPESDIHAITEIIKE